MSSHGGREVKKYSQFFGKRRPSSHSNGHRSVVQSSENISSESITDGIAHPTVSESIKFVKKPRANSSTMSVHDLNPVLSTLSDSHMEQTSTKAMKMVLNDALSKKSGVIVDEYDDDNNNGLMEDEIEMDNEVSIKSSSLVTSHVTNTKFNDLPISLLSKRALTEKLEYTFMTTVQEQSIPAVLSGSDVFVKAKTGTGKTLAFLIPSLEILLQAKNKYQNEGGIKPMILIISPTRELALQIASEADSLCSFYSPKILISTFVGGTSVPQDEKNINRRDGNDIIIATPGRLLMHLQETRDFANKCKGVVCLVLDEADRLLDMGFKPDIDKICSYLKKAFDETKPRQTLLFSATFSNEVKIVADSFLRRGYQIIDTVGEEVEQTHSHVPQHIMTVPVMETVPTLVYLLTKQMKEPDYKVMVFFPTAMQTAYYARLISSMGIEVMEIHSRKSQSYRTRTSELFREAKKAILFTSDVTARGMDYPDVTLVIQIGMTSREQYIHRLGRTARAGKEGSGLLICAPFEVRVMQSELGDMPLVIDESPMASISTDPEVSRRLANIERLQREAQDDAKPAWRAWLGFYKGFLKKFHWNVNDLVRTSRDIALSMGLTELPPIERKTLGKMGLMGVAGLVVQTDGGGASGGRGGQNQGGRGRGGGGGRSQSSGKGDPRANKPQTATTTSSASTFEQGNSQVRTPSAPQSSQGRGGEGLSNRKLPNSQRKEGDGFEKRSFVGGSNKPWKKDQTK